MKSVEVKLNPGKQSMQGEFKSRHATLRFPATLGEGNYELTAEAKDSGGKVVSKAALSISSLRRPIGGQ